SPAVRKVSIDRSIRENPNARNGLTPKKRFRTMQTMPFSLRAAVKEVQDVSFLTARTFLGAFRRPYYVRDTLAQMDSIGVGSVPVVVLTGFFTGAVLALQSAKTLSTFGAVGETGRAVSISLVRELGPVIGSLMVT